MKLDRLLTEQVNPASSDIDSKPTVEVLRLINGQDQAVARAVEKEIPMIAEAVDAIVERLRKRGRLFYIGTGTSGRLGVLDPPACPPPFQWPPGLGRAITSDAEAALA